MNNTKAIAILVSLVLPVYIQIEVCGIVVLLSLDFLLPVIGLKYIPAGSCTDGKRKLYQGKDTFEKNIRCKKKTGKALLITDPPTTSITTLS